MLRRSASMSAKVCSGHRMCRMVAHVRRHEDAATARRRRSSMLVPVAATAIKPQPGRGGDVGGANRDLVGDDDIGCRDPLRDLGRRHYRKGDEIGGKAERAEAHLRRQRFAIEKTIRSGDMMEAPSLPMGTGAGRSQPARKVRQR